MKLILPATLLLMSTLFGKAQVWNISGTITFVNY